jgi:hypothetical protein
MGDSEEEQAPLSEEQDDQVAEKPAEEPQSEEAGAAEAGEEDASAKSEEEASAEDSSEEDEEGPDEYEQVGCHRVARGLGSNARSNGARRVAQHAHCVCRACSLLSGSSALACLHTRTLHTPLHPRLQDGFLVGEGEDEDEDEGDGGGEGGADGARKRKRKRRKGPRDFKLDDEDYDLLEDAQIVVKRPADRNKRLKRRGGEDAGMMGAQQLKESLFGAGGAPWLRTAAVVARLQATAVLHATG